LPTASLVEKSDICVCVFKEFDIFKVTKTILEAVTLSHCYVMNLNQFQQWEWELTEWVFNGKEIFTCFRWCVEWELCVLRDTIVNPSNVGAQGSEIIVTTLSDRVVSVARTMCYRLIELSKEDCWSLFAKHAFYYSLPYIFFYFLF
jgi:hypothetical protein